MDTATDAANKLHTSQSGLPQSVCGAVYTSAGGYGGSVANLADISLERDSVFGDGYALQMAAVTGSFANTPSPCRWGWTSSAAVREV